MISVRYTLRSLPDNSTAAAPPVPHDLSLAGRVAVVTGGSRGIGRAIAEKLAERGAAVGVMFREREAPAREFETAARADGGRAWAGQCDVADEPAVAAFFERATAELGPIDILVNNAGITRDAHVMFLDAARWDEVLSVNLERGVSLRARGGAGMLCGAGAGSSTCRRPARGCRCRARPATRRPKPGSKG